MPPLPVSCLACGSPGDYRLCGRVNGDRQESTPRTAAASSSAPVLSHTQPRPPQETLPHEQAALAQSAAVTARFPASWCTKDFIYALREWSLFPQSCGHPVIKSCWPSKSDSLRISSPSVRFPRLGSRMLSSEPSQESGNFFGIMFLQFVGRPPLGMGSDFYHDCIPQPSHCGFSFIFGHRVSFFSGFPHLPVNGRSVASCDFGVLKEGNEHMSFYFTIFHKFYYNVSWYSYFVFSRLDIH